MSTPVRCLVCGWTTERVRTGDSHGYGDCNKCGYPMELMGTARALSRLNGAKRDFAEWGLAMSEKSPHSRRIH